MTERLGIFGGSFDPIHLGHLLLAETFREELRLDQVIFVPTAVSPLKAGGPIASDQHRLALIDLAIGGHDQMIVSNVELTRGGVSYTVETLEHFAAKWPKASLYLLLGADAVRDFAAWRDPDRIGQLATPILGPRGDAKPDLSPLIPFLSDVRMAETTSHRLPGPHVDISSTDIRHRVATGRSIRYRVPRAVEAYLASHGVYRGPSEWSASGSLLSE